MEMDLNLSSIPPKDQTSFYTNPILPWESTKKEI